MTSHNMEENSRYGKEMRPRRPSTPADDMAVVDMLKGATFGPNAKLILPTGTVLNGSEADALVNISGYTMCTCVAVDGTLTCTCTSDTGADKPERDFARDLDDTLTIIQPGDPCFSRYCDKPNDGTGSGYCSHKCYNEYHPEVNPLAPLREVAPPNQPTTLKGYAEWLTLRTAALHKWIELDEKDLLLETVKRMESDIRGIRAMLNKGDEPPKLGPLDTSERQIIRGEKNMRKARKWSPFI